MIQLSVLVWALAAFFGYVGWLRGWTKEIIALAGVTLGLFAMNEFQTLFNNIFSDLPPDQRFYLQSALFIIIIFFAYQTRALEDGNRRVTERDELQSKALGAIVGFLNGYLIGGTIWYFLIVHPNPQNNYALAPYVVSPMEGTASAAAVQNLPLNVLTTGTNGDLLSLMVVLLFVLVLVLI